MRALKTILINWKTTVGGVAALCLSIGQMGAALKAAAEGDYQTAVETGAQGWQAIGTAIVGIALMFARDGDKSTEESR